MSTVIKLIPCNEKKIKVRYKMCVLKKKIQIFYN